ncbi:hypothetical protein PGT21_032384 [Puccinia graminis f. sp. tritici]|uniref:Uncharacterized protein n=1 Tax=Puccinia graminis f. sp. tritici TaxID=56615 RepID=A0A5B0R4U8_PUCGR|nr:hypothetical protein PGT21_032384 [Puccinia graminis f. sp. tritici]KAA1120596.1 hypothetical protein PGTUg99_005534 [Puccinia graminis f. sp. tritici]
MSVLAASDPQNKMTGFLDSLVESSLDTSSKSIKNHLGQIDNEVTWVQLVGQIFNTNQSLVSNIVLQKICPLSFNVDHLGIPGDVGAYGIALDALLKGRSAQPSTVDC